MLDPSALLEARDRLAPVFAGRPEDDDILFDLSQDGSRIRFADDARMWHTTDPARLPKSPLEAEIAGRAFIGRVNTAIQNDRSLAGVGITRIFADDIRVARIGIVNDPWRRVPDHWAVKFDAYLPTGTETGSVPVYGATIDVRVGSDSEVVGCWTRWRHCIPEGMVPLLDPAQTPSPNDGDAVPAILLYLLADEGVQLRYIAPYYFVRIGDDDGDFFPASLFSPIARIVDDPSSNMPAVAAAVSGGSGRYAFRWAAWNIANLQNGVADLGSDDRIELQPGCYNVILQVTDTLTSVVVYTERSVYTQMFKPEVATS